MEYINDNRLVIGVSAGSLIFSNNLDNNLGLIDTKLDVHCTIGERRGKLTYPVKNNVKLTNTCALVIRDFPDGMEIIGEPADDYPNLFVTTFTGNNILSGGICKIEGSVIVFIVNVVLTVLFILLLRNNRPLPEYEQSVFEHHLV